MLNIYVTFQAKLLVLNFFAHQSGSTKNAKYLCYFSGETSSVGIVTLTENINDIAVVFLGGNLVVESEPTQMQYILNVRAEDQDERTSVK